MSPAPTQHGNARLVDIDRRPPRREDPIRVPEPVEGSGGLFVVDASWGEIRRWRRSARSGIAEFSRARPGPSLRRGLDPDPGVNRQRSIGTRQDGI